MNNFRECGTNCDSINDIVIEPIKSVSIAMANLNNLYNKEIEKVSKSVERAKSNLSQWSDEVENCPNKMSNSTNVPTWSIPTTRTPFPIQNLTILQTSTTVRIIPTFPGFLTLPSINSTSSPNPARLLTLSSTRSLPAVQNLTIPQTPTTVRISPTTVVSPTVPTLKQIVGTISTVKALEMLKTG